MSLHLGNLSSRACRDELERVFQRFGRCYVQLKDKFGFVVYDFPANAERALKTLRGRNICGEPITISWSNRQPRPLQSFERVGRSYESHRRHFGRNGNRKLHSDGRQEYRMGSRQVEAFNSRLNSDDRVDGTTGYHQDSIEGYMGEKQQNFGADLHGEGRGVVTDLVHGNRWEERLGEPSNQNGLENGLEFDRYEPYNEDDTKNEDGNHYITYAGSSPNLMKSQEKNVMQEVGGGALTKTESTRSKQTCCYICGEPGHKMRNCPQDNGSRRKKFNRFENSKQTDVLNFRGKGDNEQQRLASKSQTSFQSSRGDVLRQDEGVGKSSSSRRYRKMKMCGNSAEADGNQRAQKRDFGHSGMGDEDAGRRHTKKARRPVSSPIHSDYTASRSQSNSKLSKCLSHSSFRSRSRSVTLKKHCVSSSFSGTRSHYSGLKGLKSRSSSPASLSLSVSLGQALPSSPRKGRSDQKDSFVNATDLESIKLLTGKGNLMHVDVGSDIQIIENRMSVENENRALSFKVEEDLNKDQSMRNDDNRYAVPCASPVMETLLTLPSVGSEFDGESLSAQNFGEKRELISDIVVSEATKNREPEVSSRSSNAKSLSIPSNEIYLVLEHYGLEHPEEKEKDLPGESFFGSARMWPWEIIYYRRLRKGPISTENYARRIAQNKQFNIADKYVRSSSGWGEIGQDDS